MADGLIDYDPDGQDAHPALKGFNRPLEMVKHVGKKALKWAAIAAIAGAVVLGVIPGLLAMAGTSLGAVLNLIPFVGDTLAGAVAEKSLSGLASAAMSGLSFGAVAGAVVGGLSGAASADEGADEAAMRRIANHENMEERKLSRQSFAMEHEMHRMNIAQQQLALQQQQMAMQADMGGSLQTPGVPMMGQGSGRGMV